MIFVLDLIKMPVRRWMIVRGSVEMMILKNTVILHWLKYVVRSKINLLVKTRLTVCGKNEEMMIINHVTTVPQLNNQILTIANVDFTYTNSVLALVLPTLFRSMLIP